MDLSDIDEATRETSSLRKTEMGVHDRVNQHLKKMTRFIGRMHQKVQLQGNRRQAALLSNTDDPKEADEVFTSLQFFISHFKLASVDQNKQIVSLANTLPNLFEMLKK